MCDNRTWSYELYLICIWKNSKGACLQKNRSGYILSPETMTSPDFRIKSGALLLYVIINPDIPGSGLIDLNFHRLTFVTDRETKGKAGHNNL